MCPTSHSGRNPWVRSPRLCCWRAVGVETAAIFLRWYESYQMGIGRAPLTNLYESLVFFALTIAIVYLLMERKFGIKTAGAFVTPFPFLIMAYASLNPNEIQPLVPALQSNWLISHVVTCFVGYAAFAVSFGVSFLYLFKVNAEQQARDRKKGIRFWITCRLRICSTRSVIKPSPSASRF